MTQEEKWRDLQREIRSYGIKNIRIMAENELYSSIEKEQFISLIHSLVKRDEERVQENQGLKDMVGS